MRDYALPWLIVAGLAVYSLVQGFRTHGVLSGVWFGVALLAVGAASWLIILAMPGT